MATKRQVRILKRGVTVWNQWRREHPEVEPDFRGADLKGAFLSAANLQAADLCFANLSEANLAGAYLNGAKLTGATLNDANLFDAFLHDANLEGADLEGTDLSHAKFAGASLIGASLVGAFLFSTSLRDVKLNGAYLFDAELLGAYLNGANLTGAKLKGAKLISADLSGAEFSRVILDRTVFANADLREVKGLENVQHNGPSEISVSTIYRSEGQIPEIFLRGCGVPEAFITRIPALIAAMQPIQFYSCFISYSTKDQLFAERLYADLQDKGVRCWYAPEDLKIGDKMRDRIDESIRQKDKLLLILSEHSIASDWVEHEVESALEEERQSMRTILFPIRIDDAVLESTKAWAALIRRTRHIGDFTRWKDQNQYQKGSERLLRDLEAKLTS